MLYEATLIISPQVSHEEVFSLWENINSQAQQLGASLKKEVKPLERNLAYPIKKGGSFRRAYMGILYLEPEKEAGVFARALHDFLASQQSLLRFMVATIKEIPQTTRKATPLRTSAAQHTIEKESSVHSTTRTAEESEKEDKPPLAELDKKLEEILDDKIGF